MLDWDVQVIVSWFLSDSFHDEKISIVAEEDDEIYK
jgi:3'(2'), 5'-bisphosphate nucleotidase